MNRTRKNTPAAPPATGSARNSDLSKIPSILVALLLVAVTVSVYATMPGNGFAYYDDESYVTANTHIQKGLSWAGLKWAFTSIGYSDNWHPLTWISHMADIQLFGLNPAGHHFTNLLLHIIATLLLFGFLLSATGRLWPGAIVAALFALHPLHVESVAWVAERKDVLSAVFWFATLWAYVYYVRKSTVARYALTIALFALGLMAKPMLVTLPLVLLLLDYWPLNRLTVSRRPWGRLAVEKLPLVLLAVASSVITIIAQRGAIGSLEKFTLLTRVSNAVVSYCIYIGQAIWPAELSVLYSYPRPQPVTTIICLLLLTTITAVVIRAGGNKKYLITGWLWYVVTLIPVIGILQVGSQPHADRYTYIPLVGIFIVVVWGVFEFAKKTTRINRMILRVLAVAIFIAMAIKSREQIGYWKNGITLFTHGFDVTKGQVSENAYYNFGNLMMEANRTDEAMSLYRKALEINPRHAKSHVNYALLLSNADQADEAIAHYREAVRYGDDAEAHNNLGNCFAKMRLTDSATVHFRKALELNSGYGDAHYNFGYMLLNLGRTDDAMPHFRKVLEIDPADGEAHLMLGTLCANIGRTDEAIAHFKKALEINPDAIGPLQNIALAFVQKGQLADAMAIVQNALASARSAGDDVRVTKIEQILSKIREITDSTRSK